MATPKRGEVWLIDLGYAGKRRPGLVMSVAFQDEDRAMVTIVSHTTSTRATPYEVPVNVRFLDSGAFDVQNVASISSAKIERKLGTLSNEQMELVENALRTWLGL